MDNQEIEKAKQWLNWCKKEEVFLPYTSNILQYVEQLEQENKKLNKMIDEMTKYIANVNTDIFCDTDKYEKDIEDNIIGCDEDCEECVKYCFKKKVEEK